MDSSKVHIRTVSQTGRLSTAEMIEKMAAKGYWTSPGGKTPAATLDSVLLRDLKQGKDSRFKNSDKGRFALA